MIYRDAMYRMAQRLHERLARRVRKLVGRFYRIGPTILDHWAEHDDVDVMPHPCSECSDWFNYPVDPGDRCPLTWDREHNRPYRCFKTNYDSMEEALEANRRGEWPWPHRRPIANHRKD